MPGYCGILPPSFKGIVSTWCPSHRVTWSPLFGLYHNKCCLILQHYVDGGFTSMQPVLPETRSQTLTVSPFSGDTDICPAEESSRWEMVVSGTTLNCTGANTLRIFNALYPMALEVRPSFVYHWMYFFVHNLLYWCWWITVNAGHKF